MKENSLRTAILAGALVVFFALPASAFAGQVIPPGNSAATQYTQAFPTSGGNVEVRESIGEPNEKKSPSKVIGKKTTQELESQGPEGTAVAQIAAESAPSTEAEPERSESSSSGSAGGGGGNGGNGAGGGHKPSGGQAQANGGGANSGGAGNGGGQSGNQAGAAQTVNTAASEAAGSGSSGFSEVLGQATGSTSGQMGVFLPLVLLGALVFALAYAWRRRQHEHGAAS